MQVRHRVHRQLQQEDKGRKAKQFPGKKGIQNHSKLEDGGDEGRSPVNMMLNLILPQKAGTRQE
jgi:hypothetical protein